MYYAIEKLLYNEYFVARYDENDVLTFDHKYRVLSLKAAAITVKDCFKNYGKLPVYIYDTTGKLEILEEALDALANS